MDAYEVKWESYRALAAKGPTGVQLTSRNQKHLTTDYRSAVRAVNALVVGGAVLDGEIVALDADGSDLFASSRSRPAVVAHNAYALDVNAIDDVLEQIHVALATINVHRASFLAPFSSSVCRHALCFHRTPRANRRVRVGLRQRFAAPEYAAIRVEVT